MLLRGKRAWHLCGNKVVVDLKEHHQAGHSACTTLFHFDFSDMEAAFHKVGM